MEEISGVESVLEFLRKNGLSHSESALMEDIMEKSHLGASDFEKFLFPTVPPLPLLKIPSTRRLTEVSGDGGDGGGHTTSGASSPDEFVSLGSSTTEFCSSEFTNPYGIRTTTRPTSQASSDRLSQFGTARDYPDFDVQNDQLWYQEKDEDYLTPHLFNDSDLTIGPSEDKFVMTVVETKKRSESQWPLIIVDPAKHDNFLVDTEFKCEGGNNKDEQGQGRLVYTYPFRVEEERDPQYDTYYTNTRVSKSITEFPDYLPNEDYSEPEPQKPDGLAYDEGIAPSDELQMYETNEDEYEIFHLRIIHRKNRTGFEENKDLPIVINSIIGARYYVTEYLGSAAFSKVIQAHDLHTGMDVCLKIIKNDKDFFDQSLDEIKLLKYVNKHDPGDERHILRLYDYFYHQEHLFIVCELLRANLYEFQKFNRESGGEPYFTLPRLQVITGQCLEALEFLHGLGIIHCDLKPENILIKSYRRCEVKVIDLGSSCFEADNLSLYVQSRSYRAPEVILGLPYDHKIDLWSLGCILAELCSGEVLFPNEGIVMLLARMVGMFGPIDMDMLLNGQETHKYFTKEFDLFHLNEETHEIEYIIPEESLLENQLQVSDSDFIDFVKCLLEINPKRRLSARDALEHPWLSQC